MLSTRRRMSLPTLPTSEHDIVVPLPGQASIDSRLKHLRVPPHRRAQQKTPSGLVIDPVELLQCIGGSDATFSVQSTTTYSHPRQAVTVVSSSSANQEPLFSFPSSSEGEDHTSVSSHAQHPHEESTQESSRVVEHFEVDPHARSVLAFRRNSLRQFSSLVEESEDQETSSFPPPTGKIQCRDNWSFSNSSCLLLNLWAMSWENLFLPYANNKGADQPAQSRSPISAFAVHCLNSIIHILAISKISRL